jgi:2-polyprenyl-3-methyl-5-hydroxy-6-metoxy-1,4-benzoquinol methylase
MNSVLTAWHAYGREPLSQRLHVLVRALTCPFGPLLDRFPRAGAVLDVGCGHGLLVNLLARDPRRAGLRLSGIDHDPEKVEVACRTAPPGVEFSTRGLDRFPEAAFDVVTIIDVLYTVRKSVWEDILKGCFRVLRPGGTLIVKEVVDRPRWKYWAIMAQESLAVMIFKITKGDPPHFESAAVYCRALESAGFTIADASPLRSANWISHHLFVANKPTDARRIPATAFLPDP